MKDLEKIITKELLRRVLPKEIENLSNNFSFYIDEDNIVFNDDGEMQFEYCIYKFAFKCKEWAKTKKMYINSIYNEFYWDRIEKEYFADIPNKNKSFYSDTEVEAIIKACEWILKEIKDK